MRKHLSIFLPTLLVLYEIATYLSNDMYLPALPVMMHDLGLNSARAQLTLTYWFLGSACMPLFVGALSDRFGRRPILLLGGIIYILSSIICAMTTQMSWFLSARFIEGAMVPFMIVPGYAFIHERFEKKDAIKILAFMGSIVILAPALGPLLGSLLLLQASWRGIFWFIIIWSSVIIFLLSLWMPESLSKENRQPIHLGELLHCYWRIFINKYFILNMLVLGFIFGGFIAWISSGPLIVIETFHYSQVSFGLIQAFIFAAYIVGNRIVAKLLDKLGIEKLIWLGLFITFLGGVAMVLLGLLLPTSLMAFIAGMTIYSFGSALCFSPLNRTIVETSTEPMGMRVAVFTIGLMGFASIGSAVAGFMFNGTIISIASLIGFAIFLSYLFKSYTDRRGFFIRYEFFN